MSFHSTIIHFVSFFYAIILNQLVFNLLPIQFRHGHVKYPTEINSTWENL